MDDIHIRFITTHPRVLAMLKTGWLWPLDGRPMVCGIGANHVCDARERPRVQEIEVAVGIDGGLLPDMPVTTLYGGNSWLANTWVAGVPPSFAQIKAACQDQGKAGATDREWAIGFAWPHAIPAYAVRSIHAPDRRSAHRIERMASRMLGGFSGVEPAIEIGLPAGKRIVRDLPDEYHTEQAFNAPDRVRRRDRIAGGLAMAAVAAPDDHAMAECIDDAPWLLTSPLGRCSGVPASRDEYVWCAFVAAGRLRPKDIMAAAHPDYNDGTFAETAAVHLANAVEGGKLADHAAVSLAPYVGRALQAAIRNPDPKAMVRWLEANPRDGVSLTAAMMVGMATGYSQLPLELRGDADQRRDVLFTTYLTDDDGPGYSAKWPRRLSEQLTLPLPPLGIPQTALAA